MKYWYDFEFVERGNEFPITPLSLGIVAEDDRELYVQFREGIWPALYNPWLVEHVLPQLQHFELGSPEGDFQTVTVCTEKHEDEHSKRLGWQTKDCPWRSTGDMALELALFFDPNRPWQSCTAGKPELWGYYADYDHVCYAQLFGVMSALPPGFPRWTRDIKQFAWMLGNPELPEQGKGEHNALADAKWNRKAYNFLVDYFFEIGPDDIRKTFILSMGM